jgi:hypothetical protein
MKTDEELLECAIQIDEPSISVTQSLNDQSFDAGEAAPFRFVLKNNDKQTFGRHDT